MSAERVAVILVTHNSASVIAEAIQSLPKGVDVIAVDNASDDATISVLNDLGVQVCPSTTNIGFGRACNLGAGKTGREFLLFLNPDAVLQAGALDELVSAADVHPRAAALNPRILRPDGSQFFRVRSHLFPQTLRSARVYPTGDQSVSVLSGAAFLMRRETFETLGGFDPAIFLYCEDDDLGLRIQNAGWQVRYVHDAIVMHQGNRSSAPSRALDRFKAYHEMRSRWYTAHKHGVPFSRAGRTIQAAINWCFACLTLDIKKRDKYGAHIKALMAAAPTPAQEPSHDKNEPCEPD